MSSGQDRPPFNRLLSGLVALQVLNIYTAAGVASFGWSLAHLLRFRCDHYLPLWFFGTLFIYNLDRLKLDSADLINSPERTRSMVRFRKVGVPVTWLSACGVVLFPLLERDWSLLGLTVLAGVVSASYSVAIFGIRLKTFLAPKTFFVPLFITAAFLIPALLLQPIVLPWWHLVSVAAWTFLVLLFNVFLCDQRDVQGDASTGIRTLPLVLGPLQSRRFLTILFGSIALLSIASAFQNASAWSWIFLLLTPYLAWLCVASKKPQPETFYEWGVGGLLFIPLAGCLLSSISAGSFRPW